MAVTNDDFFERLLATFQIEAQEHLKAMSLGLLELEKIPDEADQAAIVEVVFRDAHSLKGAARAVNLTDVEAVCQSLEDVFTLLKRHQLVLSATLFDILHNSLDVVNALLSSPEEDHYNRVTQAITQLDHLVQAGKLEPETTVELAPYASVKAMPSTASVEEQAPLPPKKKTHLPPLPVPETATHLPQPEPAKPETTARQTKTETDLPKQRNDFNSVKSTKPRASSVIDKSGTSDVIRISVTKLDSLLLQIEEMLTAKLIVGQKAVDLRQAMSLFDMWQKEWEKVRPVAQAVRRTLAANKNSSRLTQSDLNLEKLFTFLEWNHEHTKIITDRLADLVKSTEQDHRSVGAMVDNLLEDMKKALMLPFSSLLEILPKMARDLSRAQNKDVDLILQGSEIEIDRRILDEMKDPLIHLLRNSVGHGLETAAERQRNDKPARGTITIAVSQLDASTIKISISDDGAGINLEKVKIAAIKDGIISKQEADKLDEAQATLLIFHSALSTSSIITDISGRGLGMAIVREKVEKLGGRITVTSIRHVGTTFQIILPVTLATFRGVQVQVADQEFIIPTINIDRVLRFNQEQIKTVENKDVISLNSQLVSIVPLFKVLELAPTAKAGDNIELMRALVLGSGEKRVAFIIDEILNEQEVLVKGLGKQLVRVQNVAGATILGSGKVVPILNVADLLKSASQIDSSYSKLLTPTEDVLGVVESRKKSVMVVEDSITSRMLLKNVLEAAGYHVTTCVDGVDAFTTLKTETFVLIVSDVEMPRMNGFELTAKIRADEKLSDLPIILVTSLGSREDRERGIDVGADAYIVKSSFDQTNLLDIIQRLIP